MTYGSSTQSASVRMEHAYSRSVFFQTITHWALGLKTEKSRDRPVPLPHLSTHRSNITTIISHLKPRYISTFQMNLLFIFFACIYTCIYVLLTFTLYNIGNTVLDTHKKITSHTYTHYHQSIKKKM
jgi:hypothetical protein